MRKVLLLLLAVAVNGVAGEVGAPNPQYANAANTLAVAIVDTGASNSWTAQPYALASKHETKEFEKRVEGFDAKLSQELDAIIARKIDLLLAYDQAL